MKRELSFEVFPPKTSDGIEVLYGCLERMARLKPSFISVTYSAGNAKKGLTAEVCGHINSHYGIPSVSHLTCTGATVESVKAELNKLDGLGVKTILALRGDVTPEKPVVDFLHATDLMKVINERGGFRLYGACYPEGHVESKGIEEDYEVLVKKYRLGVRKFISQLFLDNDDFLRMRDEGKRLCPEASFSAGIMPVLSASSAYRMITLSGAKIPEKMKNLLSAYENDDASMRKAGVDYATEQIEGLCAEGCEGIHLYTMCKADVTEEICGRIGGYIDR